MDINDGIRYRGIAGYGEVNLEFYGIGGRPIDFSMNLFIFLQQLNFRLGDSNFFVGGKYQFSNITIPFFENSDLIDPIEFDLKNSGLSLIAEYDNLNNFLSPSKGMKLHLSYDQNLELIGSDRDWGKLNFYSHMYFPVNEKWIPALRLESSAAFGNAPFYALPYVNLRGVSALRYQGELIVLAETEQLYNLTDRWSVLGFTGIGTSFKSLNNLKAEELVWNAGGGFRYMLARIFGLKMGLDVAREPGDWAVYVVFGSSWLK